MKDLNFYIRPFKKDKYSSWVYDAKGNFIFRFEKTVSAEERKLIIFRINALDKITEQLPKDLSLVYDSKKGEILNNDNPFIIIRGWGNLTGTGANNFSAEKATKIQNDLAEYIIDKLKD